MSDLESSRSPAEALRQQILTEFKQVHKLAPADYTENCTNVVMNLVTAYAATVEREAHEKGKLEAYKNVVAWEEQYGDSPVLSALAAHKAAVSDTEARLAALQGPQEQDDTPASS